MTTTTTVQSACGNYAVKRQRASIYRGFVYSRKGKYYTARRLDRPTWVSAMSYDTVQGLKRDIDGYWAELGSGANGA
jgi:hypothetical protein